MPDEREDILKQLQQDYRNTFSTESGKRVLKDLENICFYKSTVFAPDNNVMAFKEGNRAVYLHILTILELTPDKLKELENARAQSG